MDVPGADLDGVWAATELVSWYNGHPDFAHREFDLSGKSAVIIGQGNVALDVARMLLTPPNLLASTDVTHAAWMCLRKSRIQRVHVVGRSAPERAKCTARQLRKFLTIPGCRSIACANELSETPELSPVGAVFKRLSVSQALGEKRCTFRFFLKPVSICKKGADLEVTFEKSLGQDKPAGDNIRLSAAIVVTSIGRKSKPIDAAPFDPATGTIPNDEGRVVGSHGVVPGLFVTGWVKRGPSGTIGSNRADAAETAGHVVEQLPHLPDPARSREEMVRKVLWKGCQIINFDQWRRLDDVEILRGVKRGKPREKVVDRAEMVRICTSRPGSSD